MPALSYAWPWLAPCFAVHLMSWVCYEHVSSSRLNLVRKRVVRGWSRWRCNLQQSFIRYLVATSSRPSRQLRRGRQENHRTAHSTVKSMPYALVRAQSWMRHIRYTAIRELLANLKSGVGRSSEPVRTCTPCVACFHPTYWYILALSSTPTSQLPNSANLE